MTLNELARQYEFHDSDIFTPLTAEQGTIVVDFALAVCMQDEKLQARYARALSANEYHLILSVKFSDCTDIEAVEWEYPNEREQEKKDGLCEEKRVPLALFHDEHLCLDDIAISDEKGFCAFFSGELRCGQIRFRAKNAEVLREYCADRDAYDALWAKYGQ